MKRLFCFVTAIIVMLCFPKAAFAQAEENEELNSIMEGINSQLEDYIDDDVAESIEENEISLEDPESISEFSVSKLLDIILSKIYELSGKPFLIIGKITAVALMCVLLKSFVPDNNSVSKAFSIVSVICAVTMVLESVTQCVEAVISSLKGINAFMISYIPVYASVIATSGSPTSAGSYYVTLFSLCEIITLIANKVFLPMMSIVLAISIIEAINPSLSFCRVALSLKKLINWLLGAIMTIFVGVLSIQSIIGVSGDSVGIKAARFAVSTFVPVVGGAVSDAYSTVRGSMGIIRSGVGGFGIIVVLFIVLQPIILSALLRLVTTICAIICEILDEKELGLLMRNTSAVISMCLSTIVCVSLVFIVSTAVLMLAGLNLN